MPTFLLLSSSRLVSTVTRVTRSYSTPVANKSNLSKLRRSTGYTFALCREALVQNDNDYAKALAWLKSEAVRRGWSTAGKLANRPLSQGLLGVTVSRLSAVIVEVNCETDFVARNEQFQSLVATAAEAVMTDITANPTKSTWTSSELIILPSAGSSSTQKLGDLTTSVIGSLGENMALRRAFALSNRGDSGDQPPCSRLATYVHTSAAGATHAIRDVKFGKYAAAIRYRPAGDQPATAAWYERASRMGAQICQHIVGMNPKPGLLDAQVSTSADPDEEQCLLLQPFILDENVRVGDHLARNDMVLEQFIRVECGHEVESEESEPGSTAESAN